jgi:hypothetical protein
MDHEGLSSFVNHSIQTVCYRYFSPPLFRHGIHYTDEAAWNLRMYFVIVISGLDHQMAPHTCSTTSITNASIRSCKHAQPPENQFILDT